MSRGGVRAKLRLTTDMGKWVTRGPLLEKPIHRWFTFPHSFTSDLVHSLIEDWGLSEEDSIVDPFAGAGTTVLAAKERRVPAVGYDLSPLAAFVTRVKTSNYEDLERLRLVSEELERRIADHAGNGRVTDFAPVVRRALPGLLLPTLASCRDEINSLPSCQKEKDFLTLALLATIPKYSRARPSGGWLKWTPNPSRSSSFLGTFRQKVDEMLSDLAMVKLPARNDWRAGVADARGLPEPAQRHSGLITSPPYPNRHDYTRVFCIELLFAFLDAEELRSLRRQTIESHPEARPLRDESTPYEQPELLERTLGQVRRGGADRRVPRMLEGYFLDMFLTLLEARRVCRRGSRIALVVGNAQYAGVPILVDEIVATLGERVGLRCEDLAVVRLRGNSAQQMAKWGRQPSRETVVTFERT